MDLGSTTAGKAQRETHQAFEGKMNYTISAKPLDFSFMRIHNVAQLRKEHARGGLRKEIIQSDDEEDSKKNENINPANEENTQEETKAPELKEKVIRAPQTQQITAILLNNNISLQNNKNTLGGRKVEETKAETKKKIIVKKQTTSLFLQNNEIRSVLELPKVLLDVMYNSQNLLWLDLSYNYLELIEGDLLSFTQLQTLYLHGNYIKNLEETKKLNGFRNLQSLTLYGNPIETIKNYRLWVLGVMYTYNENLRRLDQVMVTNREFDKVLVWKEIIFQKDFKKLKNMVPTVDKKVPALPKNEEEEKNKNSQ